VSSEREREKTGQRLTRGEETDEREDEPSDSYVSLVREPFLEWTASMKAEDERRK